MARETFISGAEDMQWLRDVHLKRLLPRFKSAIIVGNEDCPDEIKVYASADPRYDAVPIRFVRDGECGRYRRARGR